MLLLFHSKVNKFSVDKFWVTFHGREYFFLSSSCLLPPAVSRSRMNKKNLEKVLQCKIKFFPHSLSLGMRDYYYYLRRWKRFLFSFSRVFFAPPELIDEKVFSYIFFSLHKGMENRKFLIYPYTLLCLFKTSFCWKCKSQWIRGRNRKEKLIKK